MICYLPFTHILATPFEPLARSLGPLTVYTPSKSLVSERMHQWQQQGLIELRISAQVREAELVNLLQEYKNWAALHDGHIGDMVHFFNTSQGRPPMVDEMAPSQIRTQVRHFGEDAAKDTASGETDTLLQAALYIALAQEYDQDQERLSSDLKTVKDMEQAMFATIGGRPDGAGTVEENDSSIGNAPHAEDTGAFMTEKRLQAWARMALSDARPSWAYVTSSHAVFEHLKGLVAETVDLPSWHVSPQANDPDLKQQRLGALKTLKDAPSLKAVELDPKLCGRPEDGTLVMEWIGCSGFLFDSLWPGQSAPEVCNNTLLGLIRPSK